MKKILFAFVAGLIPALATTTQTYAQSQSVVASAEPGKHFNTRYTPDLLEKSSILNFGEVNTKAVKNFRKAYKATDEQWCAVKDGVTARFTAGDVSNIVYYDKKGHWEGSLKGYNEDKMDRELRKMVRQTYYDYKITYVQEIETNDNISQPTYIVHIESDKDFKLIRINDGEMDVYQAYDRN